MCTSKAFMIVIWSILIWLKHVHHNISWPNGTFALYSSLLTNSSRSKDLKGGLNSFSVVICIQCNHPSFKKFLKCSKLCHFTIKKGKKKKLRKQSIKQRSQQKNYDTNNLELFLLFPGWWKATIMAFGPLLCHLDKNNYIWCVLVGHRILHI